MTKSTDIPKKPIKLRWDETITAANEWYEEKNDIDKQPLKKQVEYWKEMYYDLLGQYKAEGEYL